MNSSIRTVRIFVFLFVFALVPAALLQAADKKTTPPPAARDPATELNDLEALLNNLEKNLGTYDEQQRRSLYARLLEKADKIGIELKRQRDLHNAAVAAQPKNDPTGGLTKTVNETQTRRQNELNNLDGRLKALRARIAALNPDLKVGVPRGGGAGGGGATTVTPSTGDRKK